MRGATALQTMAAVLKVLGVLVLAIVPGGLLVLAAYVLARGVAERWRLEQGTAGARIAKALVHVRWRDVWTSAKQTL